MEWTVKYAPRTLNDLVGNKSNYTKLLTWLKNYYAVKPSARGKAFKYMTLLVGPPGIGKTSGIIAISKELHFELIEFNASDQRNANIISRLVGRETKTHVNPGYKGKIILLDEVDGIQGREDKGGLAALMKLAKESVHPIICTANDPQSTKIRSLKNSTMTITLQFKKPENSEMVTLLENIVKREGLTVAPKLLQVICNNANGDIRGAVNDLENLSQERKDIPMNAIQALSVRDSEVSIDLALRQIFGEAKTLRQAQEVTSDLDVDYSMFMQYVIENIPNHSSYPTELEGMFSNAARADLFYGRIMQSQHWKYLKYYFYFLSAGVFSSKESPYRQSYPKFPSSIMMLSRTKKVRAIRNSVTQKFGRLNHCSKNKINNYSLPYIRLVFEQLFELYSSKKLDTSKGQDLLETVSSIHNQIDLEEEEFFYLFNDPMYDKQTAAEEKRQQTLIKLIEERALEIRKEKIITHNKELNRLLAFQYHARQVAPTTKQPFAEGDKEVPTTQELPKKKSRKVAAKKVVEEQSRTPDKKNLDTFELEEKNAKPSKKKTTKRSGTQKEDEKISELALNPKKEKKDTERQKGLLDFTKPNKPTTKKKKKKDSKNLTDFM